mgnify:FL=1
MSARTGFTPRSADLQLAIGDVVAKRLGLHSNEPDVLYTVTKVNHCSVSVRGITRGRGSKNRSRIFTFRRAEAESTLTVVRRHDRSHRS